MNWQTEGMRTDWIRVMTPDGGSSESVKSNRGFVFIPEVGDHVLVGFRYNDPGRPYVMGSLFNGTTAGGGSEGNKLKSITTRSGSSLLLDDSDGSVTLHDHGGVNMNFDGRGSHSLNAGSCSCTNVGEDASVLKMDKDGNIKLKGKQHIRFEIDKDTYIDIKHGAIELHAATIAVVGTNKSSIGTDATASTGLTINQEGETTCIQSNSTTINGSTDVNISGGIVEIN